MKKLLLSLSLLLLAGGLYAQTLRTIDEIRTTNSDIAPNDTSIYNGELIQVRGTVLTDPNQWYQAGQSTPRYGFFIVDSSMSGPRTGLQVYLFDGSQSTATGVANIVPGNYVQVEGTVDYFSGQIQIDLTGGSVNVIQSSAPAPAPASITLDQLHDANMAAVASGNQWEGSYVEITNVQVTQPTSNPDRGDFDVLQSGTQVDIWDGFQFMRDRNYPGAVPAAGTQYDTIRGLVYHRAFPGGDDQYEIFPLSGNDLVIGNAPPLLSNLERDIACPTSSDQVVISVEAASADPGNPLQDVDSVVLRWGTGLNNVTYNSVEMTNTSGNIYSATIPAEANGTLISYYVEAFETSYGGSPLVSSLPDRTPRAYTVNDNGCTIADIQRVPDTRFAFTTRWPSGYEELTVTDVSGVVTAKFEAPQPTGGYKMVIQDRTVNSWGAIELTGDPDIYTLDVGDSVVITNATVTEFFGLTKLEVQSNGFSDEGAVTAVEARTDLGVNYFDGDSMNHDRERFESMLLGFDDNGLVVVNDEIDDFGDWRVGTDALDPNAGIRIQTGRTDASSLDVSYVNDSTWENQDGDMQVAVCVVEEGVTTMDYLQGILSYSFDDINLLPRDNNDFDNVEGTSCTTSSVEEFSVAESVNIFPNPASNSINFVSNGQAAQEYSVQLINLNGQVVKRAVIANQGQINIAELPNGTYILRAVGQDGTAITSKVVKY